MDENKCGMCKFFNKDRIGVFGECELTGSKTSMHTVGCDEYETGFDLPLDAIESEQSRHSTNIPECFQMDANVMAQFSDEIFAVIKKVADIVEMESDMWVICEMAKKYLTGIVELERLQSLESHGDTYESERLCFVYHEMNGICTIEIIGLTDKTHNKSVTVDHPLHHKEFIKWCAEYELNLG